MKSICLKISLTMFCFCSINIWGAEYQELRKLEDSIWRSNNIEEAKRKHKKVLHDKNNFPQNKGLELDLALLPTNEKDNMGGGILKLKNTRPDTVNANIYIEVESFWGEEVLKFEKKVKLKKGKTFSQKCVFKILENKPYKLTVRVIENKKVTEKVFFPYLNCYYGSRQSLKTNGGWKYLSTNSLNSLPGSKNWKSIKIPHHMDKFKNDKNMYMWFKRTVRIPESFKGKQIYLVFNRIRLNPKLYINNRLAGQQQGGLLPLKFEISKLVKFGQNNEILVGCSDYNTVKVKEDGKLKFIQPVGFPRRKSIGISGHVSIITTPLVAVKDCFLRTDLIKKKRISLDIWLENNSTSMENYTISVNIIDKGKVLKTFPSKKVSLLNGKTIKISWRSNFKKAKLWWPHAPNLYQCEVKIIKDKQVIDKYSLRFGIKKFEVKGNKLVLNNINVRLLRVSSMLQWGSYSPEEEYEWLTKIKKMGYNTVRYHIVPGQQYNYDLCDELGLFTIAEGAIYTDLPKFAIKSKNFWLNCQKHLKNLALMLRNHVSLIMYCPENEFIYCFGATPDAKKILPVNLPKLGASIRKIDSTRPFSYDGEGDVYGYSETKNLHYISDWSQRRELPNKALKIEKSKKPLILGEYMCSSFSSSPECLVETAGPGALRPQIKKMPVAIFKREFTEQIRLYTDAYRLAGVAGLNPWWKNSDLVTPVLVTDINIPRGFTAGKKRKIPLTIINDTTKEIEGKLIVYLKSKEQQGESYSKSISVSPGKRVKATAKVKGISVLFPTECRLFIEFVEKGKKVFKRSSYAKVFPNEDYNLKHGWIYDKYNKVSNKRIFSKLKHVRTIKQIPLNAKLVVIAPKAINRMRGQDIKYIRKIVINGGRVLVLPRNDTSKLSPCIISFDKNYKNTFAFVQASFHPLLKKLQSDDFAMWGRDNYVVKNGAWIKPALGNTTSILQAGDRSGLKWSPLIEVKSGRGSFIFCQLDLIKKIFEPAAKQLLKNFCQYASGDANITRKVIAPKSLSSQLVNLLKLQGLKLNFIDIENLLDKRWEKAILILGSDCSVNPTQTDIISKWLKTSNAILWLHKIGADKLKQFQKINGNITCKKIPEKGVELSFANVPQNQAVIANSSKLFDGIGNQELKWKNGKIADYYISKYTKDWQNLLWPSVLLEKKIASSRVILDYINWDKPSSDNQLYANQILCNMLNNMGAVLNIKRLYTAQELFSPVKLPLKGSSKHNRTLQKLSKRFYSKHENLNPRYYWGNVLFDLPKDCSSFPLVVNKNLTLNMVGKNTDDIYIAHALMRKLPRETKACTYVFELEDGSKIEKTIKAGNEIGYLERTHTVQGIEDKEPPKGCSIGWMGKINNKDLNIYIYKIKLAPKTKVKKLFIKNVSANTKLVLFGVSKSENVYSTSFLTNSARLYSKNKLKNPKLKQDLHIGDKLTWKLKNINKGRYYISLKVRTGGNKKNPVGLLNNYILKVNNKSVKLHDPGTPVVCTGGASDGSWYIYWGFFRTEKTITLKEGDVLTLTVKANHMKTSELKLDLQVRTKETIQRDMTGLLKVPIIKQIQLSMVSYNH